MSTKNRFFNIIAHDLRSPFNALLGFSELLYLNYDSFTGDKIQMMTKAMYDTSKSAFKLVENLLTWSRSQSGKLKFEPTFCSLNTIIDNPISGVDLMAKNKNINIKKTITENVNVCVDKNLIYTVLRNLISNAVKFTKPNGEIKIDTKIIDEFVEISVSDTGVGIEKSRVGDLFKIDAANSTEGTENEAGTGLGLILCKEFIEKHGGEIWVESELNKGSTFYFTIPLAEKSSQ
ncbi:MAG: HAMP domain-containing histidine kinase [Bacteroidales bacterium]|nr:HAMP domain-containing histidine kinase [Bacteroidales bacterium]